MTNLTRKKKERKEKKRKIITFWAGSSKLESVGICFKFLEELVRFEKIIEVHPMFLSVGNKEINPLLDILDSLLQGGQLSGWLVVRRGFLLFLQRIQT